MADAATSPNSNPQSDPPPSDNANPTKFFRYFLYKAVLITFFLVLLPIFPSIAPEFVNQTLHARSWELLQLILVGIAVSYGLFSKRNDEMEKDANYGAKLDNAQSYVSKLLQVSSVFDDESDQNQTVIDENKVQTWSSQYYRGEPPVFVVPKENPVVADENGAVSELGQNKPLLLPVRSLKQQSDESVGRTRAAVSSASRRTVRSNSSRRLRNEDVGRVGDRDKMEDVLEDNNDVVLRSPIPWRSRSGRMEVNENANGDMEDQELSRIESRSFKANKMSPLMPFPPKSQPKSSEDVARKKGFMSPPPDPPPPPPPPPPPASLFVRKPALTKSNSSVISSGAAPKKALRRSFRSVPMEEASESEREAPVRIVNPRAELGGQAVPSGGPSLRKSVRTFRVNDQTVLEADKRGKKMGYSDMPLNVKLPTELVEKVVVESSDDEDSLESDTEADRVGGSSGNGEVGSDDNGGNELGPDVDKKADEFIAKFREQIRLQRIESIRKSTAQRGGRSFR